MAALLRDLRFAVRTLRRDRLFSLAAVAALTVGIGLTSAVFSLVDAVVWRPLPVPHQERLIRLFSATPEDPLSHSPLTWSELVDLRQRVSSLESVAAFAYTAFVLEEGGTGRLVLGELVTGNYFSTLGVVPALGRFVAPEEAPEPESGPSAAPRLAVLSHSAWSRRFGADLEVVGRTVRLNGEPFTVIGVAPGDFFGLTRGIVPELWIPLGARRPLLPLTDAEGEENGLETAAPETSEPAFLWGVARRAPGRPLERVRSEVATLSSGETGTRLSSRTLLAEPASHVRILPGLDRSLESGSWLLLGVVALVLLIACSNVANLCLARTLGRRGEIATRVSLGAGAGAIVRQLLVEGLLLAGAGAVLGLLFAAASGRALAALRLPIPVDVMVGARVDARVLVFTVAVAGLTAVVFSLAPAFAAVRTDLIREMREGGAALSRRRRSLSRAAVVVQIAVSLVLLVAAGLCLRSLWRAGDVDLGFEPRGAVVATFAPHLQGYDEERSDRFYRRLVSQVRALPGVEAAGLTSHLPLTFELRFDRVRAVESSDPAMRVDSALVGPGYFAAMGIRLLEGSDVEGNAWARQAGVERAARTDGVVINDALARRLWRNGRAIGRRLWIEGLDGSREVVGVVATGKARTLGESPRPFLYRPRESRGAEGGGGALQVTSGTVTLVARVAEEPGRALAAIEGKAREVDRAIAISRLTTLEAAVAPALLLPRAAAALFAVFGALGLILAAIGTYGLMAHANGVRRHEIGIRLAIGARRREVERMLVREGIVLALVGVACGLVLAGLLGRFLEPLLFGVDPFDVPTFVLASAVLLAAGVAASYLPARQVARVEPSAALRYE